MKNFRWLQVVIPISVGAASCGVKVSQNEDGKTAASSEKFSSDENEIFSLAATNKPSVSTMFDELNIAYRTDVDSKYTSQVSLDVHYAEQGKVKPVFLFVHGGGWISGDKADAANSQVSQLGDFVRDNGHLLVSINYRLVDVEGFRKGLPGPTYREQASDVASALAWVKKNISKYGGDPENIVLAGHSAGAHLVPLVALDSRYLSAVGLSASAIKKAVSLDVHAYHIPNAIPLMENNAAFATQIPSIKMMFGQTQAEQLEASPENFIVAKKSLPAFLVISAKYMNGTTQDITNQMSTAFVNRLTSSGYSATHFHYENESHPSLVTDINTAGDQPAVALKNFLVNGNGDSSTNLIFVDCEKGIDSNSGTTSSKPFKTIAKARASLLNSDGLMLRRGATCYETLSLDLSASSNKNTFTIGVFGSGDAPAYLFAAPLQSLKWTVAKDISINGNVVSYLKNRPIYSADVPYRAAQMLDSALIPQPQARHPNNDWEFLSGVSAVQEGNSWFALTVPVYAFAEYGATRNETVTYRLNNWFAQKFPLWAYTKNTSLLKLSKAVDPVYRGTALPKYGYRYQNSLAALDTPGEWYQDYNGGGKIYYWPANNAAPTGRFVIPPQAVDVISLSGGKRSVVIRDVDIIGAGGNGISVMQLPEVKIDKVGVWAANEYGIMIWKVPTAEIRNSKINGSNKTGIKVDDLSDVVIANNSLENNGRFATQAEIGMELDGIRIATVTTSSLVQNNLIKSSGYAGINAAGLSGSATISKNDIQDSCLYLNNCGAIYLTGKGMKAAVQVTENKISNSFGNQSGGGGEGDMATGIYLNWVLSNSAISKNVIEKADNKIHGSIFVHGGSNNKISDNIITVSSPDIAGILTLTEGNTGSVPQGNVFERNSCVFPMGKKGNCVLNK